MLGKLFRHEAKIQGKVVAGMYGALVAATTLMIAIYYLSRFANARVFQSIFMIACALYGMTVIVVVIVNFIYLCFRFYKSMYSEQGYLTHTLPVKTTHILHVKIVVSFAYLFLTAVLCLLSFCSIGIVIDGTSIGQIMEVIKIAVADTAAQLRIPDAVFLLFFAVMAVLGCLNALLLFFAGSSIGQLFHRSKGACGIAAGIGLYYMSQIVSLIAVAVGFFVYTSVADAHEAVWAMGGGCLLVLFWTAVYYTICRVIVQKHLNLE